jgi:hypothetical protein
VRTIIATPRRRWFQLSLRTLFVLVAMLGCALGWVGFQWQVVRQRSKMLTWIENRHVGSPAITTWTSPPDYMQDGQPLGIPWIRRLLGDQWHLTIMLRKDKFDSEEIDLVTRTFPEAAICIGE